MASIDFLHELLRRSADGAYIVDQDQRIVAWNDAAEALLGFRAQDVVGLSCYQVLGGHSEGGCIVCRRGCLPFTAGRRGERVPTFDVQVRTTEGHARWVNVSVIAVAVESDEGEAPVAVVHLFRDAEEKKQAEIFTKEVANRARQLKLHPEDRKAQTGEDSLAAPLTPRERQVLNLLSRGADTSAIAGQLVIGKSTVRNHIERILHKLGVHSRLEAVTYAQEHHLLD